MKISILVGLILLNTAFIDPAPHSIYIGEIVYIGLFVIVIFIFATQVLMRGSIQISSNYLYIPLLCIFILTIASLWQGIVVNGTPFYLWLRGFIPFVNYLIFFLLIRELRSLSNLYILIGFLLASALVILFKIIFVIANAYPLNLLEIRAALPRHAFQPHILASFGFLIGYATESSGKKRLCAILLALIFLASMLVTISRSLTLLAILIGIIGIMRRTRFPVILLKLIILCITFAFLFSLISAKKTVNLHSIWISRFSRNILEDVRVEESAAVLKEFAKHPILGNGLGYQYSYYRSAINLEWEGGYTHNFITYILLTMGLVGLIIFLWLLGTILLELHLTYKAVAKSQNEQIRSIFWGLVLCLIGVLLYSLMQSIFRALAFPIIVSFTLAGIVSLRRIITERLLIPTNL
ncbi:MAG: O-antigen ligase family protein [Armatimonadetes bacterium]|nr:O-antigen ligase family protein [Armatimonadota bacterium]